METIVNLCKRRGFVFKSSEIYGGTAACWDFGPLGVEVKKNIKELWWRDCVQLRDDIAGLDSSIITLSEVLKASGHVDHFHDPMVDCKSCKKRYKADEVKDKCPECGGELTPPRKFNLMFKTFMGPVEDEASIVYLRPETAQGIFVNFNNVLNCFRKKLPFGIAQIGKSFRNEITPSNFLFRTREFEQMEIEFFVTPETADHWYRYWVEERYNWYIKYGIKKENLRKREHQQHELAHYAISCTDLEYKFPMGWCELEGIANRGNYDLSRHSKFSGKKLTYFDDQKKEYLIPYVIEPSAGVDRSFLAFLVDAYNEQEVRGEKRVYLAFSKEIAPIKVAVLPLLKKRTDIVELAQKITKGLKKHFLCVYDDTASIGRLYRRQDEIGTPWCITVDVKTVEEDKKVTIRDRDTMEQIRVEYEQIESVIKDLWDKGWQEVKKQTGLFFSEHAI